MPEMELDVTQEEYEVAGSKFITFPPEKQKLGQVEYRKIQIANVDWKTPGQSFDFAITVMDAGPDEGKEDHIYPGAAKNAIWKTKAILAAIDIPIKETKGGKISFDSDLCIGKEAYGVWAWIQGVNQSTQQPTFYPKLNDIVKEPGTETGQSLT